MKHDAGASMDGVFYVAFGHSYLAKALASARSVKEHNPDLGTAVVTNVPAPGLPHFDHFEYVVEEDASNRLYKTRPHKLSPFERTLFLDCDTLVQANLSELFDYLKWFDAALYFMGPRIPKTASQAERNDRRILDGRRVGDLPHWNSGVIAFKQSPAALDLLDRWHERFRALGFPSDQPALVEAIFHSPARVLSLDYRWNCPAPTAEKNPELVKIVHYKRLADAATKRRIAQAEKIVANNLQLSRA